MTTTAKAELGITSWDEGPYAEFDGGEKLTRAIVGNSYTGDLVGESRSDSLMYYGEQDAPVHYTGLERFTGSVGGRTGTFVAQSSGTFTGGVADTKWFVVPGSGGGELRGLRGEGRSVATKQSVEVTFDYDFEA